MPVPIEYYLVLSAFMFITGVAGVLTEGMLSSFLCLLN